MRFRSILITGGAGFVGSNLAVLFKQYFEHVTVTAADNLKRRGSELTLPRLRQSGVEFLHADIRCPEDLADLPDFDLLIDCSAEPSVHGGTNGSPQYVLNTNLTGTINCLEAARRRNAAFVFLSTSRVYPIQSLNALPYDENETRFVWTGTVQGRDLAFGIAEDFQLDGQRSLYGASKLACEQVIREYAATYQMPAIVNRCGILAGPWQMGRVDQGVISFWCARHYFRKPLRYTGYGGIGKQVRDVLHVEDLFALLIKQFDRMPLWTGEPFNVGGEFENSVSLRELTQICAEITGNCVDIGAVSETSPLDLRIYITDARKAKAAFDWAPQKSVRATVEDIYSWICEHQAFLEPILS